MHHVDAAIPAPLVQEACLTVPGVEVYARHQGKAKCSPEAEYPKLWTLTAQTKDEAGSVADRATVQMDAQTSKRSILKRTQKGPKRQDPGRSAFECSCPFVTRAGRALQGLCARGHREARGDRVLAFNALKDSCPFAHRGAG